MEVKIPGNYLTGERNILARYLAGATIYTDLGTGIKGTNCS